MPKLTKEMARLLRWCSLRPGPVSAPLALRAEVRRADIVVVLLPRGTDEIPKVEPVGYLSLPLSDFCRVLEHPSCNVRLQAPKDSRGGVGVIELDMDRLPTKRPVFQDCSACGCKTAVAGLPCPSCDEEV